MIVPGPDSDPFEVFDDWYAEHQRSGAEHPNAMFLATATPDGRPSLRTVLLKGVEGGSFRFFTHTASRKGDELAHNPHAALLFYWPELGRQVRVEGRASRIPDAECDAYFATRPRESQLSAWASPQSRPIPRAALERARRELEARHAGAPIPRPPEWGGYAVSPDSFELWIGEPTRLHHRHLYVRGPSGWEWSELGP